MIIVFIESDVWYVIKVQNMIRRSWSCDEKDVWDPLRTMIKVRIDMLSKDIFWIQKERNKEQIDNDPKVIITSVKDILR